MMSRCCPKCFEFFLIHPTAVFPTLVKQSALCYTVCMKHSIYAAWFRRRTVQLNAELYAIWRGGGDYLIQIFTLLLVFNKAHSCVIWRGGVPCYFFSAALRRGVLEREAARAFFAIPMAGEDWGGTTPLLPKRKHSLECRFPPQTPLFPQHAFSFFMEIYFACTAWGLPCNALPQEVSTSEDNAFVRVKQLVAARTVQSDRLRSKRSGNECRAIRAAFVSHVPQDPGLWEKRTAFCGEVGSVRKFVPRVRQVRILCNKFFPRVQRDAGASGNSFPAFNETLARAEIPSQRSTRHWRGRKLFPVSQQDTGAGGNSFPSVDRTPARAEIPSRQSTRRWNERKFFPVRPSVRKTHQQQTAA